MKRLAILLLLFISLACEISLGQSISPDLTLPLGTQLQEVEAHEVSTFSEINELVRYVRSRGVKIIFVPIRAEFDHKINSELTEDNLSEDRALVDYYTRDRYLEGGNNVAGFRGLYLERHQSVAPYFRASRMGYDQPIIITTRGVTVHILKHEFFHHLISVSRSVELERRGSELFRRDDLARSFIKQKQTEIAKLDPNSGTTAFRQYVDLALSVAEKDLELSDSRYEEMDIYRYFVEHTEAFHQGDEFALYQDMTKYENTSREILDELTYDIYFYEQLLQHGERLESARVKRIKSVRQQLVDKKQRLEASASSFVRVHERTLKDLRKRFADRR